MFIFILYGKPTLRYKTEFHWLVFRSGFLAEPMKLPNYLFMVTSFPNQMTHRT